jgi:pyruvate dehydrogenase E2 component (dihydrolipoamide acetyltransferase)
LLEEVTVAIPITVPRLGWTMDEGEFVEWLKREGEQVQPGDPLFVLESEKATETIEAFDAGILRLPRDGPKPGDKVKVGQVLAYLAAEGEAAPSRPEARSASEGAIQPLPAAPPIAVTTSVPSDQPAISPRARRVAGELGIDWSRLQGSGRNGRIRERDVRAAASTLSGGQFIPHTNVRKVIAAHMVAGITQAAPVTLTTRADAANLVNLRSQFQSAAGSAEEIVPSFTDFFLKLTAATLREHPLLQAQWRDDGLFIPDGIHIAVAVDTEAGLLAPVLRDVDKLTLRQVAARVRELAELARSGRLQASQLRGGTFTVTNLGMFGVDAFTPIVHLPQSAVLGVGRIVREPAIVDEQIVPRPVVTLSLTFDHRVVDGGPAARFLNALRLAVERPAPLLVS